MEDLPKQTRFQKENPNNKDDRYYKANLNINEHEVKPSKKAVPEGMKKVWIPELRFWIIAKKEETDQEVINRTMKRFRNL